MLDRRMIDRYSFKSNILRKIIFRVDFKGVIGLTNLITPSMSLLNEYFATGENRFHDNINIDIGDIDYEAISRTLSLPLKEVEHQEIFKLTDGKFKNSDGSHTTDRVSLDISKYFVVMDIECKDYKNIDPYMDFFLKLLCLLLEHNSFMSIKRVGIRKVASDIFFTSASLFQTFDEKYFNLCLDNSGYNTVNYDRVDVITKGYDNPVINYRRIVKSGTLTNNETKEEKEGYIAILDIDGYFDEENSGGVLFSDKKQFSEKVQLINTQLFEIFLSSMTDSFIEEKQK